MRKLKHSEIKSYREELWQLQDGICPLCNTYIEPKDAVLDHSHFSGKIRNVIHRDDNMILGKIENNFKRWRIDEARASAILSNYQDYVNYTKEIIHPTYFTPEEKVQRAKDRAKKARDKKKSLKP